MVSTRSDRKAGILKKIIGDNTNQKPSKLSEEMKRFGDLTKRSLKLKTLASPKISKDTIELKPDSTYRFLRNKHINVSATQTPPTTSKLHKNHQDEESELVEQFDDLQLHSESMIVGISASSFSSMLETNSSGKRSLGNSYSVESENKRPKIKPNTLQQSRFFTTNESSDPMSTLDSYNSILSSSALESFEKKVLSTEFVLRITYSREVTTNGGGISTTKFLRQNPKKKKHHDELTGSSDSEINKKVKKVTRLKTKRKFVPRSAPMMKDHPKKVDRPQASDSTSRKQQDKKTLRKEVRMELLKKTQEMKEKKEIYSQSKGKPTDKTTTKERIKSQAIKNNKSVIFKEEDFEMIDARSRPVSQNTTVEKTRTEQHQNSSIPRPSGKPKKEKPIEVPVEFTQAFVQSHGYGFFCIIGITPTVERLSLSGLTYTYSIPSGWELKITKCSEGTYYLECYDHAATKIPPVDQHRFNLDVTTSWNW